jgi:aspartate/methionine/tyrosine aminotransferase
MQPWPLVEKESGWGMDLDHLAELLTPKTSLLVINVPHNPTGYLPTMAEFETILSLVAARGAWLFCDEMRCIAAWSMIRPHNCPRPANVTSEPSVCGVCRKPLAGLRLGWLALRDQEVLAALKRW